MGMIGEGVEILKLVNVAANAELYGRIAKYVQEAQEQQAKVEQLLEANKDLQAQLRSKGVLIGS